jgi:hypothetical protein
VKQRYRAMLLAARGGDPRQIISLEFAVLDAPQTLDTEEQRSAARKAARQMDWTPHDVLTVERLTT